jgi:hypothetical protein
VIRKGAPSLQGVEAAIFAFLLLVILGQTYYLVTYVQQQRETTAKVLCQSDVNTAFRRALLERSDSSARERQAQRDLLTALAVQPPPEEARVVYRRYFDVLDQADRDRAANPLPTTTC